MTAVLPEDSTTRSVRSLEVRWICPGALDQAMVEWFSRFPAVTETRRDNYLVSPGLQGLSVKVRAGRALEVKVCQSCPGILDVPGRARGHLQSWRKWSFPFRQAGHHSSQLAGWRPVNKRRRICRFVPAGEQMVADRAQPGPACTAELAEICAHGETWWSLAYEATGPADLLRSEVEATARMVFAQPLPDGVELSIKHSRSFAEWLSLPTATTARWRVAVPAGSAD